MWASPVAPVTFVSRAPATKRDTATSGEKVTEKCESAGARALTSTASGFAEVDALPEPERVSVVKLESSDAAALAFPFVVVALLVTLAV